MKFVWVALKFVFFSVKSGVSFCLKRGHVGGGGGGGIRRCSLCAAAARFSRTMNESQFVCTR